MLKQLLPHPSILNTFQMTQHQVCDNCKAVKLETETEEIELEVEPGMQDGMTQKFSGTLIFFVLLRRNLIIALKRK